MRRPQGKQVGESHDTGTGATFLTSVSPDGRWVAAGSESGHTVRVWRSHPWSLAGEIARAPDCTQHVGPWFTDDGKLMLVSFGQVVLRTYEVGSWRPLKATPIGENTEVSADGSVGVWADETQAKTIDARTRAALAPLPPPADGRYVLSPDGRHVAAREAGRYVVRASRTGAVAAAWPRP